MTPSDVMTLEAPVGGDEVTSFLPLLGAALTGRGPALLPLPRDQEGMRHRLLGLADPTRPLNPPEIALLVPTSGSSGSPKLAMLSRSAVLASVRATHDALGGPGQWLLALPTTHIAGLQVLCRSLVAGFPPVVVDTESGFRVNTFADAVEHLRATDGTHPRYASIVPTQLRRVLDAGGAALSALIALDAVLLGGAASSPRLVEQAKSAGVTVVQSYGMTETCGGCIYDGVPLAGVHVTFESDGRIRLNGPMMFSGYRGDDELTSITLVDGALVTNDTGHFDESHRLVIDGRLDDVVITGGVNVSCATVEQALTEHPLIRDIAVVGVPDAEWGERIVAIAVSDRPLTLDDVRTFGRDRLDAAALPRQLLVVESIPSLPNGKPDRPALKSLAARAH